MSARPTTWWRGLSALVPPKVPERIEPDHWRTGGRVALVTLIVIGVLNASARTLLSRASDVSVAAYDRFLCLNLPALAIAAILLGWMLLRERSDAQYRVATTAALVCSQIALAVGLWMMGSLSSLVNTLMCLVVVIVVRVYYDRRVGRAVAFAAIGLHGGVVALEIARVVPLHPLYPTLSDPNYLSASTQITAFTYIASAYTLGWMGAGYMARRIRLSEHSLRELNSSLEARVLEQVSQLERAGRLRRYLAPQVADRLLSEKVDPGTLQERRHVTVLFADLKGFTQLVERVSPEVLSSVLELYFEEMTQIAYRHGGTIDKFIGDAIMILFGAPEATGDADQARRCVRMAVEMQRRLSEIQPDFARRGVIDALEMRIGISSGLATVGSFGSVARSDFTAVGAAVNRAARLEPLAPPGGIALDGETVALMDGAPTVTEYGAHALKGFRDPVPVYLVALRSVE